MRLLCAFELYWIYVINFLLLLVLLLFGNFHLPYIYIKVGYFYKTFHVRKKRVLNISYRNQKCWWICYTYSCQNESLLSFVHFLHLTFSFALKLKIVLGNSVKNLISCSAHWKISPFAPKWHLIKDTLILKDCQNLISSPAHGKISPFSAKYIVSSDSHLYLQTLPKSYVLPFSRENISLRP